MKGLFHILALFTENIIVNRREMMNIKGHHHMSAITANARQNLNFYINILGLRLVKKTVNQDDTSVYHLFYGDEKGNPGTELTFFEIPIASKNREGFNSISATSLCVANDAALSYWKQRFAAYHVEHGKIREIAGRLTLSFKDHEGQRFHLVADEHHSDGKGGTPWKKSPVPQPYGLRGLGPISLTVQRAETTKKVLTDVMGFRQKGQYPSHVPGQPDVSVLETGEGGAGAEVHLEERNDLQREQLGYGGVHHIAFRVDNEEELKRGIQILNHAGIPHSGMIDRFYFRSLYFREPNGILFELATDGPGFAIDETIDRLGETLSLPPFLESKREEIEAKLAPLNIIDVVNEEKK